MRWSYFAIRSKMAIRKVFGGTKPAINILFVSRFDMFGFFKNHSYSIGVDIGEDCLKVAQLGTNGNGITLIDGGSRNRPAYVKPGSADWQKWTIEALCQVAETGKFHGKDVIAAIPASEIFIDHIKMPKIEGSTANPKKSVLGADDKLADAIFAKIKQKLPFEPTRENTMIKYIPTEDDNVLVMATERKIIDRHLAIYEKTGLKIKSIGVWPIAIVNVYTRFFGRRKSDIQAIVMLVCIESSCTNVVISRHKNLLFARSIPIGSKQLEDEADAKSNEEPSGTEKIVTRLVLELTACKRQFSSMYRDNQIERLVFLSGQAVDRELCATIAKQMEMPAQIGDCLAAIEITDPCRLGIDRRVSNPVRDLSLIGANAMETAMQKKKRVNWATTFGLSLS